MHLPHLISDLALLLLVAGVITVLFKKLKQPLVLGYIVAGVLTGPHLSAGIEEALSKINLSVSLPTVVDTASIEVWSEIGIIFLMFALGLEFSFHKLANVGQTAIITAIIEVCGMLALGFGVGIAMGWGTMNSLILGAILSMSSTTIIIKAFDELNLKGKKFTELVFGGLIVEDIAGIFIMVFLSTFAASQGAGAGEIAWTIVQLLFYLILWLLLGIYLIPTLLKKAQKLMNDETLLIVSLGLCLGVVLLFVEIGFSSALGAFIAGSILAGTLHATRIEHLTKPIKDLFGAVFFISVGMMVDPAVIIQYAVPILLISLVTIFGKLIFSSLGVLLAGNKLHTAISCGTSLAQIGEFAFIIALLAERLDLTDAFIYPIIVSVSVITTFTTPYCIKSAEKIYGIVKKILPNKILDQLDSYTSDTQTEQEKDNLWQRFLKTYFTRLLIYTVTIIGIIQLNIHFIAPFLNGFLHVTWAIVLSTLIPLGLMAPFIFSLLRQHPKEHTLLMVRNRANRFPMLVFMIVRLAIAVFFVMYTINQFMGIPMAWLILPALIIISVLLRFDSIFGLYLRIEARFLGNFNEKQLNEWAEKEKGAPIGSWLSDELWVGQYRFKQNFEKNFDPETESNEKMAKLKHKRAKRMEQAKRRSKYFKEETAESMLANLLVMMVNRFYNISIIKITSGKKHINLPENGRGNTQKLHVGDTLFLLGPKEQLDNFNDTDNFRIFLAEQSPPVTLRSFIENQDPDQEENHLLYFALSIDKNSDFVGKSIKDSGIRKKWNCMVIGLQRDVYPMVSPKAQTIISNGDRLWVLGSQKMFQKMLQAGFIQSES